MNVDLFEFHPVPPSEQYLLQEMLLSKFMESQSKNEGTEAGKMMSYIGYAEEYMSKKRNMLYPSITRIMTVSVEIDLRGMS